GSPGNDSVPGPRRVAGETYWPALRLLGAIGRHEELAVRTLEALVTFGGARDQLGRESLLAVRAHDFVCGALCGEIRHTGNVPVSLLLREKEPVRVERGALGHRWLV